MKKGITRELYEQNLKNKEKVCSKCNQLLPLEYFNKNKRNTTGYSCYCRECEKKINKIQYEKNPQIKLNSTSNYYKKNKVESDRKKKEYYKEHPDILHNTSLKKLYNITLDDYNKLLKIQNGNCAICKQPCSTIDYRNGNIRNLYVDHNHKTGKVRGLLCNNCNLGLSKFKDSKEFLINAANYLDNGD